MQASSEQQALLNKHLELVLQANRQLNLTRITNWNDAQIHHIEDSLAGLDELNKAPEGELLDLGSGGGFPGIPLAICSGRTTTLCETVGKKADCLKSFISEIGLEAQISVSNCRSEELAVEKPNFYAAVSVRAVSSLASILELAAPLLMTKGLLVCYKSLAIEEELEAVNKIEDKLGFKHISNRTYTLSDNETKHQIILYQKIAEPSVKLPRKLGLAQKRPLD